MNFIIGIDLDENNKEFSVAVIAKNENDIIKIIDSKISNYCDIIKEFVKSYEPEYFTLKYKFKEQQILKIKKLAEDDKLLIPLNNPKLLDELKMFSFKKLTRK